MDNHTDMKDLVVDGYLFATEEEAQVARKELQGIQFLQRNNNIKDIKVLKQIYQKLLQQGLFKTPIGLNYLKRLQSAIIAKEGSENITPIPVNSAKTLSATSLRERKTMMDLNDVGGIYRKRFHLALIVIAILGGCLVFMIGIAATTNQPNILNYEEKIIDKYEHWEQELNERESQLKE